MGVRLWGDDVSNLGLIEYTKLVSGIARVPR